MNLLNNSKLTRKGFIIYKKFLNEQIKKEIECDLIVQPYINPEFGCVSPYFAVYGENDNKLYLPRFYAVKKFGLPSKIDLDIGDKITTKFIGKLKKDQIEPVEKTLKSIKKTGGGILSLECGGGKTCCALYIWTQLRVKCLVIVHKDFLMKQWAERIKQFTNGTIGIIKQNKIEIENCDIVIGMLQSISMKDYSKNLFNSFGMVIVDEAHHISSQVFSQALPKISTKYMLGLTATPTRKDGLTKVFKWYLGDISYIRKREEDNNVIVNKYLFFDPDNKYCKEQKNHFYKLNLSSMITNICNFKPRIDMIINITKQLLLEKRKILILSDRRKHLNDIMINLNENNIFNAGYYVGGMKEEELNKSEKCLIILATYSMASEGLDIPSLNTLILASPKSDIVQSVGRILRKKHNMIKPIIVDIVDQFSIFVKQSSKRHIYYEKCGYDIKQIDYYTGEIIKEKIECKKKPIILETNELCIEFESD